MIDRTRYTHRLHAAVSGPVFFGHVVIVYNQTRQRSSPLSTDVPEGWSKSGRREVEFGILGIFGTREGAIAEGPIARANYIYVKPRVFSLRSNII
jgi:hypothetical protein